MDAPFLVLVVCRANICRSPLARALLVRYVQQAGLSAVVSVTSAGTDALVGERGCADAAAWFGSPGLAMGAEQVSPLLLRRADLVLTADRDNGAACSQLDPGCRTRLFTLTQAATLARHVDEQMAAGLPLPGAPATPDESVARLRWLVAEMDAARSLLSGRDEEGDDIPDRHGPDEHSRAFAEVDAAVRTLADALGACVRTPRRGG